MKTIIRCHVLS